ncbi:MAG: helicase RepA family protein, partial [Clostridiales bacterium]|nr:helicase RepA family protein [Clostridiales bacterium]
RDPSDHQQSWWLSPWAVIGEDAPDNLYIVTKSPKMGKGFEDSIRETVKEHPDIKVVVVDVFRYIRPPRGRNVDPYEKDYEDYSAVKALAEELRLAIILVTHTTKMKHPDDPFNELTGSAGTMGSVDMAMVIKKDNRDSKTAKLYITGRDLEERCYEMSFNKDSFRWEKHGSTEEVSQNKRKEEYEKSPVVNTIRMLVAQNNGRWEGAVSDIISASECCKGMEIVDNVAKVGKEIRRFSECLYKYDAIAFRDDRMNKKRTVKFEYMFSDCESTPSKTAVETVAVTDADINT